MASSSVGGSDSAVNQPQSEFDASAGEEVDSSANQEGAEPVSALAAIDKSKAKAGISDQLSVVAVDAADVVSAPKAVASSLVAVEPKVYSPTVVRKIEVKKERLAEDGSIYRSQEWVLAQEDAAYTAQVLGSYNEQTAKQFVQRNKGSAPQLYYVKTKYKGRDWFVVLYGAFDSKSLAGRALKQSAKAVQAQKPWLRSFSGIKNSFAK
jgi:septal ring-binding cell division protein DamX